MGHYLADPEIVAAAKCAKAALRRAFPATKFSVTGDPQMRVEWTDDGPSLKEVENVLLAMRLVKEVPYLENKRHLQVNGRTVIFDRYNAADRAAWRTRWEDLRH